MKVRVLEDIELLNADKLLRFDTINAEYRGTGSYSYGAHNINRKYLTTELEFELPEEWWTSIPNLDKIHIPANIKHNVSEIVPNFMKWYNNISNGGLNYESVWQAYGVMKNLKYTTDYSSEFSVQDIRFQDFFDIYYFYVMPWLENSNLTNMEDCKIVEMYPDCNKIEINSILLEANDILNGDRNEQYNDPNESFKVYAEILKATFGIELTPVEICKVQMAIKLGRLKYKYKRDSLVDLCGYSEILHRLESNNDNNN